MNVCIDRAVKCQGHKSLKELLRREFSSYDLQVLLLGLSGGPLGLRCLHLIVGHGGLCLSAEKLLPRLSPGETGATLSSRELTKQVVTLIGQQGRADKDSSPFPSNILPVTGYSGSDLLQGIVGADDEFQRMIVEGVERAHREIGLHAPLECILDQMGFGLKRSRYRIAYVCEGSTLHLGCDAGEVIHMIRANFGRFSISLCNDNGNTNWDVQCMSPMSLRVLHKNCSRRQSCSIPANSSYFGDPCPETHKYLEAHYQCLPEGVYRPLTLLTSLNPPPQVATLVIFI
ncbi:unnamed protein product [Cyprideis torosa]|uniref:Uncharacterized protein n=1 Tax=Cyprideis torosa TaxID=163714 RepID=A0A7R8WLD8_9CRUS|nr:unnamed protein product [Cyprideis torosa]CAG0897875.1 unnamed protein product [Cyprideis torosa]